MRRRILLTGTAVVLLGVVVLAQAPVAPPAVPPGTVPAVPAAEPIPPTPPRTLPETPATPVPPAGAPEAPLNRFEPLSSFPESTQSAVAGVVMGADWMVRRCEPNGRFMFGYNPSLRQPMAGDHDLKQARGALALAQAAKFTGDKRQAAIASQAILVLLAATRTDPADANCRVPVHSSMMCNRVGFAGVVALAIYELPNADRKLLDQAEQLCEFLHRQCRADGSVHYADGPADDPAKTDPAGVNEYPGAALHAIMAGNRVRPAAWKTEVMKKGVEFYRAAFRARPHPLLAATLTPACAELYLQTKLGDAAAAVFEMNDWLRGLQIAGNDSRVPQWAGGFRAVVDGRQADVPPGVETGLYVQSLACACQLARATTDLDRYAKYRASATEAVRFLTGLQYQEANTRHFETTFRAGMLVGGFHLSPADGNLRIDATGTAVTGLLRFLESGAEK